ncbi:hypothetical protein B0H14DRAFT_2560696 [Mycena olivaceomarginata]|nr:hypothetical protein B0H14DRAFT_2560696 [Mycena olivaceomarginata]
MARGKRKADFYAEADDLNDGSDSDDSADGYIARSRVERIHHIPDESISIDSSGRTRVTKSTVPTPASPAKKTRVKLNADQPPPPASPPFQPEWEPGDFTEFDAEYGPGLQKPSRDQRESDDPHGQWARDDREDFLDELLRHDGRGDYIAQALCAAGCQTPNPVYRCSDCLHPCLFCEVCIKAIHERTPLHHIEKWNGESFERCTLKSLGVRIQLGHALGVLCPNPEKAWGDDFVIISSHTIDEVGLDYCNCSTAQSKHVQLLRMRLYPATGTNPRSAATFSALRRFAHMTFESKCSGYKFYNSLARETNNTGSDPSRERYDKFLRMTRRGHDPCEDRVNATKPGELALLCPACPQPGKNLPPNWQNVPFERAFLYALYLAIDANFWLQRKDVSSEERDPGLSRGWAFFGDVVRYMAHLEANRAQPQERSTCVAHDAVDKPDRESLGTVSSGIGTVDCARHNMKRPLGVGDLQRGERYLNMDYMFFMSLMGSLVLWLYVSYDIACQWYKNIWVRMQIFEKEAQFKRNEKKDVFLVPKFHLPAHIERCNIDFSFNLTRFVGRTDGEAPERGWADANRLANSTKISGPGARRDTLNAHFQYSNWKKITKLGTLLLERMQKSVPMMLETRAAWVDFEASIRPSAIAAWTAMAVAWEDDDTNPNPFATTSTHEDLSEVRRQLAEIAAADVDHLRVRGDMHETELLSMGLQLEAQQRLLATHMAKIGLHETADQATKRLERETKLRRKIEAWMAVQQLFMPEVAVIRERESAERKRVAATQALPGIKAYEMKLWFLSAMGPERCEIPGRRPRVHAKMRSGARTDAIQVRIDSAAAEYRVARAALVQLSIGKERDWLGYLQPLLAADVRGRPSAVFGDDERRKRGGSKKKRPRVERDEDPEVAKMRAEEGKGMSWIWKSEGTTGTEEDVVNSEPLRIEWAKTRAKAMRYAEEVDLLEEEMRRVLQFLDWRAEWWQSQVGLRVEKQPEEALREGHAAYAMKQAGVHEDDESSLCEELGKAWRSCWWTRVRTTRRW